MTIQFASGLAALPQLKGREIFAGFAAKSPHLASPTAKLDRKIVDSIEEAVRRTGLENGMTVSFHHGFREGDKTINMVVDILARMGFRDLTLASSSLQSSNSVLIEHIKSGLIRRIYSSGMRGKLAEAISNGLMDEPINIHSHGGRVALIQSGEIAIDVAFLGVSACDSFGNANGVSGRSRCGSLGYAMVDAHYARNVVMLTEEIVPFPNTPASIRQDQVDWIVKVDQVGDPSKISVGAARATTNPRELLIARLSADVMEHSRLLQRRLLDADGNRRLGDRDHTLPRNPHARQGHQGGLGARRPDRRHGRSARKGPDRHAARHAKLRFGGCRTRCAPRRATSRSRPRSTPTRPARAARWTASTWSSCRPWRSTSTSTSMC